eukprot:10906-Heterococcus_DN1.PRE.1
MYQQYVKHVQTWHIVVARHGSVYSSTKYIRQQLHKCTQLHLVLLRITSSRWTSVTWHTDVCCIVRKELC